MSDRLTTRPLRAWIIGAGFIVALALLLTTSPAAAQRIPGAVPRPPTMLNLPMASLGTLEAIRREQRTLRYKEAIEALRPEA